MLSSQPPISISAPTASRRSGLRGKLANLTRSEVMSRIRGTGNKTTEQRMIAVLRASGITGWRRHTTLPGKPDFAFPKLRLAIFVDGCFWHGCPTHFKPPKANAEFWAKKIRTNKARDRKADRLLRAKGWRVIRIWEHSLRVRDIPKFLRQLRRVLEASRPYRE